MFEHLIGNDQVKQYLQRIAQKKTVGNSLLFAGPDGIGKSLFAEAFAKLLICQNDQDGKHYCKIEAGSHPDIRIYKPEGKIGMHSIASMRHFSEEVYLAPFEAKWKVFIIHEADRMLSYSANALLKTFEEPALNSLIILLSSSPSMLLPTILSRCRTIHFQPLSEEEIATALVRRGIRTAEEAHSIASMAQGSLGHAFRLAQKGNHPLRSLLLNMLSKGGMADYKQLSELATSIAEHFEEARKEKESAMRAALLQGAGDHLSALQKQAIEKEAEGAASMHSNQEVRALFDVILAWYRDLHLLSVNGRREYLMHRDYANACSQAYERGKLIPLDAVQKSISEACLSLERSTSLNICFENLFLKLNLLTIAN